MTGGSAEQRLEVMITGLSMALVHHWERWPGTQEAPRDGGAQGSTDILRDSVSIMTRSCAEEMGPSYISAFLEH